MSKGKRQRCKPKIKLSIGMILLVLGVGMFGGVIPVGAQTENAWPMVAGNPERTSYTSDQLADNPHVEWYRPIEAYIPPNFQVIAANNLVYVSSARGLYAFAYDTGAFAWRYDTEIPLGNSPTIATVNGISMAFVGGYDKKIHAFNALTGQHLWEFTGAKAGFDANPLVINNTVYVGNRDGYFYAINATNGSLIWQYPAANQDGIGPIHLSPAYKNNTIYFATDYNYGYALNTDGTLKWKSAKLPGDGYNNYWPVVYTNTADSKDYVIFSGKIPYREANQPGTYSYSGEWNSSYGMYDEGLPSSFPQISLPDVWAQGKTVKNHSAVRDNIRSKSHLKIYIILDATTGTEYPEPFPVVPQANPNNQAPPVVANDLLFVDNYWGVVGGFGRHHIMGWKFGTPYFVDTGTDGAGDEPIILSGGGSNIYKILCCTRESVYVSFPSLLTGGNLWTQGNSLGNTAPGYDEMLYHQGGGPDYNLSYQYGNANGIYGYHGNQNPMVPYKNKVFTIKGNSILAFGSGTQRGKLALQPASSTAQSVGAISTSELTARLEKEIQKILSACYQNDAGQQICGTGILKPGYTDDSQFASSSRLRLLTNYFDNPGDTLIVLSQAYHHISSPTLKPSLKTFLKDSFLPRYYDPVMRFRIGWKDGAQRDSILYPPDLKADMQTLDDDYNVSPYATIDESLSWYYPLYLKLNPNNLYALYQYAKYVAPEDAMHIYQIAHNKLTTGPCQYRDCTAVPSYSAPDSRLIERPYETNAYIAGLQGFLNLQELPGVGITDSYCNTHGSEDDCQLRTNAKTELARLKNIRINHFSKDTPYGNADGYGQNFMSLSRNFVWLTPELASDLRNSKLAQVQQALDEYNIVGPYWFVSKFGAAVAESGQQNLYDYGSNFLARAWILRSSREELSKYLDVPAFERGDLFYIQNLVALIEAPYAGASPTPGSTNTPIPAKPGDANSDNRVDGLDYVIWLNNYGSNVSGRANGDFNNDNRVDGLDYVIWLNNYGS